MIKAPWPSILIYDLQKVKVPPESGTSPKPKHLFLLSTSLLSHNLLSGGNYDDQGGLSLDYKTIAQLVL